MQLDPAGTWDFIYEKANYRDYATSADGCSIYICSNHVPYFFRDYNLVY